MTRISFTGRLRRLEEAVADTLDLAAPVPCVVVGPGETEAEAKSRHGLAPDYDGPLVVLQVKDCSRSPESRP
jgi:hypothetical protein